MTSRDLVKSPVKTTVRVLVQVLSNFWKYFFYRFFNIQDCQLNLSHFLDRSSYNVTVNVTPNKDSSEKQVSFDEFLELSACLFNWADSYDAKDWTRLASIVAPTLDYTVTGKPQAMSSVEFLEMVADPLFLGDPTIKTQHLLGASSWVKVSPDYVIGHHQLRAAHQVYSDDSFTEVKRKGHSHTTNEHYYRKIEGVWKFAGLKSTIRWNDPEKVFKSVEPGTTEI